MLASARPFNSSGVVPPLGFSIALLVDFLYPAKSEDALNQTEQNREGLACLLARRIAAEWIWGFHSKSKVTQIHLWNRCWAPDQATGRPLLSFFSIWPLNLDTLNFRKIWVWILSASGSEAPQAIGRHCGEPRRVTIGCRIRTCDFQWAHLQTFLLKSNKFRCRQYLLCPVQLHRALHCSKAHY